MAKDPATSTSSYITYKAKYMLPGPFNYFQIRVGTRPGFGTFRARGEDVTYWQNHANEGGPLVFFDNQTNNTVTIPDVFFVKATPVQAAGEIAAHIADGVSTNNTLYDVILADTRYQKQHHSATSTQIQDANMYLHPEAITSYQGSNDLIIRRDSTNGGTKWTYNDLLDKLSLLWAGLGTAATAYANRNTLTGYFYPSQVKIPFQSTVSVLRRLLHESVCYVAYRPHDDSWNVFDIGETNDLGAQLNIEEFDDQLKDYATEGPGPKLDSLLGVYSWPSQNATSGATKYVQTKHSSTMLPMSSGAVQTTQDSYETVSLPLPGSNRPHNRGKLERWHAAAVVLPDGTIANQAYLDQIQTQYEARWTTAVNKQKTHERYYYGWHIIPLGPLATEVTWLQNAQGNFTRVRRYFYDEWVETEQGDNALNTPRLYGTEMYSSTNLVKMKVKGELTSTVQAVYWDGVKEGAVQINVAKPENQRDDSNYYQSGDTIYCFAPRWGYENLDGFDTFWHIIESTAAESVTWVKLFSKYKLDSPSNPTDSDKLGGGIYLGYLMTGRMDPAGLPTQSNTDLGMPEGMTVTQEKVYFLNLDEDTNDRTHCLDLNTPTYVFGWVKAESYQSGGAPPLKLIAGYSVRGEKVQNLKPLVEIEPLPYFNDYSYWTQYKDYYPDVDKNAFGGEPMTTDIVHRWYLLRPTDPKFEQGQSAPPLGAVRLGAMSRNWLMDAMGRSRFVSVESDTTKYTTPDWDWSTPVNPVWGPPASAIHMYGWTYKPGANDNNGNPTNGAWVRVNTQKATVSYFVNVGSSGSPSWQSNTADMYGLFNLDTNTNRTLPNIQMVKALQTVPGPSGSNAVDLQYKTQVITVFDAQPESAWTSLGNIGTVVASSIIADEIWINKTAVNDPVAGAQTKLSHIGPDTSNPQAAPAYMIPWTIQVATSAGQPTVATVQVPNNVSSFDVTGHKIGDSVSSPAPFLNFTGDAWVVFSASVLNAGNGSYQFKYEHSDAKNDLAFSKVVLLQPTITGSGSSWAINFPQNFVTFDAKGHYYQDTRSAPNISLPLVEVDVLVGVPQLTPQGLQFQTRKAYVPYISQTVTTTIIPTSSCTFVVT